LRLADFLCGFCGRRFEDVPEAYGEDSTPHCCGHRAKRAATGPRVNNTKRYGQFAFGREMTAKEVDAQLKKEGSWIPSENEKRIIRDMTDAGVDPVIVKPRDDRKLNKAVERAYRMMKERRQA